MTEFEDIHGIAIHKGRRVEAVASMVLLAEAHSFETQPVARLSLGWEGAEGDYHSGLTRRSGGREPWYPRGTEIRNERQLTILSSAELALIAQRMDLEEISPGWLGGNIVLDGIAHLSMLPRGTLVFFDNGVTLKIDDQNGPCRIAGQLVAQRAGIDDETVASLAFVKAAKRLRGLTAWVEKPGLIEKGEKATVKVPEQWVWEG